MVLVFSVLTPVKRVLVSVDLNSSALVRPVELKEDPKMKCRPSLPLYCSHGCVFTAVGVADHNKYLYYYLVL